MHCSPRSVLSQRFWEHMSYMRYVQVNVIARVRSDAFVIFSPSCQAESWSAFNRVPLVIRRTS